MCSKNNRYPCLSEVTSLAKKTFEYISKRLRIETAHDIIQNDDGKLAIDSAGKRLYRVLAETMLSHRQDP